MNLPDGAGGFSEYHPKTDLGQIVDIVRQPNTAYTLGDVRYSDLLVIPKKFVCVKAGTTGIGKLTGANLAEGAIITDGGVVWMVDSLADGIYTAEHKNGIVRGADITDYWNSGYMSANIQAGKFVGMYLDDRIKKTATIDGVTYSDKNYLIGDFDYHLHCGDTETTNHHILMVSEECLGTARMNSSNVTTGGYMGSEMWTTTIPKYAAGIQAAFGSEHILSHRELLTDQVNTSAASMAGAGYTGCSNHWAWASVLVNIMNEAMTYGTPAFSSSFYDIGDCNMQIALFRHCKARSFTRAQWNWLRAVAYSPNFAIAYRVGYSDYYSASYAGGVRLYFLLR